MYWLQQDSENRLAATGIGKLIGYKGKICRVQQDKTVFIARIFHWKKSENTHYDLLGSDTEVIYYGQVYALRIRCTYYTEDAVLKARGRMEFALVQLTFAGQNFDCTFVYRLKCLGMHFTATIPYIRDVINSGHNVCMSFISEFSKRPREGRPRWCF